MVNIYFAVDYVEIYKDQSRFKFDDVKLCVWNLKEKDAYAYFVISSSLSGLKKSIDNFKKEYNDVHKYMFFEAKVADDDCALAIESILVGSGMSKFDVNVVNIYDENGNIIDKL